jgi:hypothetical protein
MAHHDNHPQGSLHSGDDTYSSHWTDRAGFFLTYRLTTLKKIGVFSHDASISPSSSD